MSAPRHPAKPCREYRGARNSKGYGVVRRAGRAVLLHRWVVEEVEGRPLEPGEVVMHACDNPPCFLYEHLRRASQADNIRDAMAKGRHRFVAHVGEVNGAAKLTAAQVEEIRRRHVRRTSNTQLGNTAELAAEFNVSPGMIRNIVSGRAWKGQR